MNYDFLSFSEINFSELKDLHSESLFGSIFHHPGYWNAVTEKSWHLLRVYEKDKPVAFMPILPQKKYFLKYYWQPPFVLYANPIIVPFRYKNSYELYSRLRKIYTLIAEFLTREFRFFSFQCVPEFSYLLPFVQKGINPTLRTTFIIENYQGEKQYSEVLRRKLRKTKKSLSISQEKSPEIFLEVYRKSGKNFLQGARKEILQRILQADLPFITQKNVRSPDGNILGSAVFVEGKKEIYYLLGVQIEKMKNTAIGIMLEETIKEATTKNKIFNFEGSHIEPVERFFRSFGASPIIYPLLSKRFGFL